jgi:GlcNAc-P-P-Und epimerase
MRLLITGGSGFIGTNYVEDCIEKNIEFINVDIKPPLEKSQMPYWKECDIMDLSRLTEVFAAFKPTVVLHLAARTDTDIHDLNGDLNEYIVNTKGTDNVLDCIRNTPGIGRVIITSSMFVCKPGYVPKHDQDFSPFTLYGVSKKYTEIATRNAGLNCTWTIIRPQTIWGPWSLRYKDKMFAVMKRGLYFHPSKRNVQRAYGYVGNVVYQINRILELPDEKINKQVLYVGDAPVNLLEWVNCVSDELVSKPVRVLPTLMIRTLAVAGDALRLVRVSFPITTTRFNSMTQNYLTDINKTFQVLGEPKYSMKDGVKDFVTWYRKVSVAE